MSRDSTRERPAMFRALGKSDPPAEVTVAGEFYQFVELFKHDSWAATALYRGPNGLITCKFNRMQPVFGMSFAWLGKLLAYNERTSLEKLEDTGLTPRIPGDVVVNGRVWPNVVARQYIDGHPLGKGERVPPEFFIQLKQLLSVMHERKIAYVDLHKRENIIVGDDGKPYLIDFQIGIDAARTRVAWIPGIGWMFDILSKSDDYHLMKHVLKHDPDRATEAEFDIAKHRPWWIKLHRSFAVPFRELRRKLLVLLHIRSGKGSVESEVFAEDALRTPTETTTSQRNAA